MTGRVPWRRAGLVLAAAGPFVAYRLLPDAAPAWILSGIAAVQAAAIGWIAAARLGPRPRTLLCIGSFAAVFAATAGANLPPRMIELAAGGLCHAGAYLALLAWFARSLRPGREPVVTALARRVRQTMPASVVRYTRRVTAAWCGFFLAQLLASATLLAVAPLPLWSAYVTLLNLPLIAAMVLGEYGLRRMLFRNEPRTTLLRTILAMRHATGMPGHAP